MHYSTQTTSQGPLYAAFTQQSMRRHCFFRRSRSKSAVHARAESFVRISKQQKQHTTDREVAVALTNTSFSSRKLNATVQIDAPLEVVWSSLTDYDNLGTFIPSLVENRCLERRPQGCLLYQVGAQDVAMGVKFSAACTLEIQEYPSGIPESLCTVDGDWDAYFPCPSSGSSASSGSTSEDEQAHRDISFSLVEGDFQAFKGIWRMQSANAAETVLQYSLFVKPHPWLPVGLIQHRISSEVVTNLKAVRHHAEHLHRHQQKQMSMQSSVSNSSSSSCVSSDSINSFETDIDGSAV